MSVPSPGLRIASQLEMYRIIDGEREKQRQRSLRLFGGQNLLNSLLR